MLLRKLLRLLFALRREVSRRFGPLATIIWTRLTSLFRRDHSAISACPSISTPTTHFRSPSQCVSDDVCASLLPTDERFQSLNVPDTRASGSRDDATNTLRPSHSTNLPRPPSAGSQFSGRSQNLAQMYDIEGSNQRAREIREDKRKEVEVRQRMRTAVENSAKRSTSRLRESNSNAGTPTPSRPGSIFSRSCNSSIVQIANSSPASSAQSRTPSPSPSLVSRPASPWQTSSSHPALVRAYSVSLPHIITSPSPGPSHRSGSQSSSIQEHIVVQEPSPTDTIPTESQAQVLGSRDRISVESSYAQSSFTYISQTNEWPLLPKNRELKETNPDDIPRYMRRAQVLKNNSRHYVEELTTKFPHSIVHTLPEPWIEMVHPEGALYFYNPEKGIYTDAYVYLDAYRQEVENLTTYLEQCRDVLSRHGKDFPEGKCELVLEVGTPDLSIEGDILTWQYYYVSHKARTIFWLRPFDMQYELAAIKGMESPAHAYLLIESWYWLHLQYFPHSNTNTRDNFEQEVFHRLSSIIQFCIVDVMVCSTSTSTFTMSELQQLERVVQHLHNQSKELGALTPEALSTLARVQYYISTWRYFNCHGQRVARLNNNESIHDLTPSGGIAMRQPWFIRIISPLLFRAPEVHLRDLEAVSVDGIVSIRTWHKFFNKLLDEWKDLIFQGTVILTANVSFLAIPDVLIFPDNTPQPNAGNNIQSYLRPLRSYSALLSYLSTMVGLGSVIIGLLLARSNRSQVEQATDAGVAIEYLEHHRSPYLGLSGLAVIFSLPYALLMWASALFLGALLCFTLVLADNVTRIVVSICAMVVIYLITWSIVSDWRTRPRLTSVLNRMTNMRNDLKVKMKHYSLRKGPENETGDAYQMREMSHVTSSQPEVQA